MSDSLKLKLQRCTDLDAAAVDAATSILQLEFSPPELARIMRDRLVRLAANGSVEGVVLQVPVGIADVCTALSAWVFLRPEAMEGLRTVPMDRLDRWIVYDLLSGERGIMSRSDVAEANCTGELDLLMLVFKADDALLSDDDRSRVIQQMMQHAFPAGYHLRSLTGRVRVRSQVSSGMRAGTCLLRPDAVAPGRDDEYLPTPALLQVRRDNFDVGSWVARAFLWRPPRFGFSRMEQRSMLLALRGARDNEIASATGVSVSTVKKRWESIFLRVSEVLPELLHDGGSIGAEGRRGPEKRHMLLRYLTEHPEELRPYTIPDAPQNGVG